MSEAVTLELFHSTDNVIFTGTRKIVRILVVGTFEGDPPLVRCRLTGADSDIMIKLNGVREKSTTAMPQTDHETGKQVVRFDIIPTQPGKIVATFSIEGDKNVASINADIEVLSMDSRKFFFPRPAKGLH